MTLTERLSELVRACFTGLWIESHEHQDAQAEIAKLCHQENWRLAVWNIERGLSIAGQPETDPTGGQDPLAAIRSLSALSSQDGSAILVEYVRAVTARTHEYLATVDAAELDRIVDRRWDPPVTAGVRLVSVINDATQHAGQAAYVRGLLERSEAR